MPHSWSQLEKDNPALGEQARLRVHDRICYLSTVRKDGSPRVFPVAGFIGGGSLWLFVGEDSPKRFDLRSDGRFALHCGVEDRSGGKGEVHITGTAKEVTEPSQRAAAERAWPSGDAQPEWLLFELLPQSVTRTTYENTVPSRERWNRK